MFPVTHTVFTCDKQYYLARKISCNVSSAVLEHTEISLNNDDEVIRLFKLIKEAHLSICAQRYIGLSNKGAERRPLSLTQM